MPAPYAPRPKYAACPNECMPPGPMMKCRLVANSTAIRMSMASTTVYGYACDSTGSSSRKPSTIQPNLRVRASAGVSGASISAALRVAAPGRPKSPQGRQISTAAITRNSTTRVSLENEKLTPNSVVWPMAKHMALISAISKAARKAPGMLPMPPTTTTTKASPMASRSRPKLAGSRGACKAPPKAARNAPSANTPVNSHAWLTPSAPTISRSWVAARINTPKRVRVSTNQSSANTSGPMKISTRSYCGN